MSKNGVHLATQMPLYFSGAMAFPSPPWQLRSLIVHGITRTPTLVGVANKRQLRDSRTVRPGNPSPWRRRTALWAWLTHCRWKKQVYC